MSVRSDEWLQEQLKWRLAVSTRIFNDATELVDIVSKVLSEDNPFRRKVEGHAGWAYREYCTLTSINDEFLKDLANGR